MGEVTYTDLPEPTWYVLSDHNYAIRFWATTEYATHFMVFSAAHCRGPRVTEWMLLDDGAPHSFDEYDTVFWELKGTVKWDGCIDFETNPECMFHACGPGIGQDLCAIFDMIFSVATRLCPRTNLGSNIKVPTPPLGTLEIKPTT